MALLKRELHRQVKGPEITHADRCTLVFDTDTKHPYVESEVAHLEAKVGGTVEYQTTTMDIADYLTQGGQTAGHRELWRLLRSLFNENSDSAEYTDETPPVGRLTYIKFEIWKVAILQTVVTSTVKDASVGKSNQS